MKIDIRGRWKQRRSGKIVFNYIGLKNEFEDAKVCGCLCIRGPVKYQLKQGIGSSITQQWLFNNVIPNIRHRDDRDKRLCNVLGIALLFACMSDDTKKIFVPPEIRVRVRRAYKRLNIEEAQPVEKIPLHIHRIKKKLIINPIGKNDHVEGDGNVAVGGMTSNDAIQSLIMHQTHLENTMMEQYAAN